MPPKIKTTKEAIVKTALDIVREKGIDAINAREIARKLDCSTQPIFFNFNSMEELKEEVIKSAGDIYRDYSKEEGEKNEYPLYKATGMAYIRFAREETELFKLLFMRDRSSEKTKDDEDFSDVIEIAQKTTGLSREDALLFHLEIWAFVHGIATMVATNYTQLEWDLISAMITDVYQGLKKRYGDKNI